LIKELLLIIEMALFGAYRPSHID
jgi:mRNA export factor